MDTPVRHRPRPAGEQAAASHTPTLTTRSTLAQTPTSALVSAKAPAKQALLPDVHFSQPKDAQGKTIRPAPGLAVAPLTGGNPDQSVSMDISAEVGAHQAAPTAAAAALKSAHSSDESYSTPHNAGHQLNVSEQASRAAAIPASQHGRQLLSPAGQAQASEKLGGDKGQAGSKPKTAATGQDHLAPSPSSAGSPTVASASAAQQNSGVYSLSDEQLADRLNFEKEIGHGNWGSIWTVQPRHPNSLTPHLPATTLAAKLCHRQRTAPSNARVRSLWNEFKILKAVGSAPWPKNRNPRKASLSVGPGGRCRVMMQPPAGHPAIMRFYEFLITPSYAVILMPYFRQPMNVALPPETCRAYFQHLLSAVFWLHQNNVTHNDVKTANTMIEILPAPAGTPPDAPLNPVLHSIPILADFGFAQLHDEASVAKNFDKEGNLMPRFCTKNSWGTPEYLSPERARGDLHDERLSDLWSLGVTFFEIATGRTPFENEEEQFLTKEELAIYYERTMSGSWIGTYTISSELEDLIRGMLSPDPLQRIDEADALLHPYFVDSQLIQDAEDADDISILTDDLDASLGAVVRAQLEAVKAERSRRQAFTQDEAVPPVPKEQLLKVLDEPHGDGSVISSRPDKPQDKRSDHGRETSANGMVSTDDASHQQNSRISPNAARSSNIEEVGHHSHTSTSGYSRSRDFDKRADTEEDKHTHKHGKGKDRSFDAPHSPVQKNAELKQEGMFSPVLNKYKKALLGTPMGKSKQREAAAKEHIFTPSRAHASAIASTKVERGTPFQSPSRARVYQHQVEGGDSVDGDRSYRSERHDAETGQRHDASKSRNREQQQLGSPIMLSKELERSQETQPDARPVYSPGPSAWMPTLSAESRSFTGSKTSGLSNEHQPHGTSGKPQNGSSKLMAFARTVKRSLSKSSSLADVSGGRANLTPGTRRQQAREASGAAASKAIAVRPDKEDVESDEDDEDVSVGRKSPTLVATQARAQAANPVLQDAKRTAEVSTLARGATSGGRLRTTSEHVPPPLTPRTLDTIAGRLDAMSQHASSLLRLVEETRSTIGTTKPADQTKRIEATPLAEPTSLKHERARQADDSEDEVDRALVQRSPLVQVTVATEDSIRKNKHHRPYSMYELQRLVSKEGPSRRDASMTSEGNATAVSQVGEQSQGTTLVGDNSSAATSFPGPEQARGIVGGGDRARSPSWASKPGHHKDGAARLSVISTPLKAKVKGALYDNAYASKKAHAAQVAAVSHDYTPAYATVRKHNAVWQPHHGVEPASPVGHDSFRTANAHGSPESGQWVKVDGEQAGAHAEFKDGGAVKTHQQQPSSSSRFSMRRTRSFVLSALVNQMQNGTQDSMEATPAAAVVAETRKAYLKHREDADDAYSHVHTPGMEAHVTGAHAVRDTGAMASSTSSSVARNTIQSSVSSRAYLQQKHDSSYHNLSHVPVHGHASPVSQVPPPPAALSPRGTPAKAVTRWLKLIRGATAMGSPGGPAVGGGIEGGAEPGSRHYPGGSSRTATGTSTTSGGVDEYRYFPPTA